MAYRIKVVSDSRSIVKEGIEPLIGCSLGMMLLSDDKPVSSAVFKLTCGNAELPMCSITPYGLFTAILDSNKTVQVTIKCFIDGDNVHSETDTVANICKYTAGSQIGNGIG